MTILGLNAYHADSSVALVKGGQLVFAIEEERLNRHKHCAGFPAMAAKEALVQAGVAPADLAHVAISRDPRAHLFSKARHALGSPGLLGKVAGRIANLGKVGGASADLALQGGGLPLHRRLR